MLKYGDQCWHVHDNNSLFREWDKERRHFYKRPGAVMHTVFAFTPSKKPNEEPGTKRLDKRTCDKKGSYYFRCRLLGDSIVVGAVVTAVTDGVAAGPV